MTSAGEGMKHLIKGVKARQDRALAKRVAQRFKTAYSGPTTTIEVDLPANCDGVQALLRLLAHLRHLGVAGSSRGIDIQDAGTITGWDGDGSDRILAVRRDGKKLDLDLPKKDVDALYRY